MTLFEHEIWNASDVCQHCFCRRRREAIRPRRYQDDEHYLERDREQTDIGYAPTGSMSDSRGVFCECGVPSAFTRNWSVDDLDRDRFHELVKNLIRTLEAKAFDVDRVEFARVAIHGWNRIPRGDEHGPRRQWPVNAALEDALEEAVDRSIAQEDGGQEAAST